jgi:hypothetical protein
MSTGQIVTLVIAVLGVLHGPLTGQLLAALKKSPPPK